MFSHYFHPSTSGSNCSSQALLGRLVWISTIYKLTQSSQTTMTSNMSYKNITKWSYWVQKQNCHIWCYFCNVRTNVIMQQTNTISSHQTRYDPPELWMCYFQVVYILMYVVWPLLRKLRNYSGSSKLLLQSSFDTLILLQIFLCYTKFLFIHKGGDYVKINDLHKPEPG